MNTRNYFSPNDTEKLTQFIKAQSDIRVLIDDAGNFGNQAASYNLILRLRELGFKGEFEVIYFTDAKHKIIKLFNLPQNDKNTFYSVQHGIKFIELSEFNKQALANNVKQIALGLTGATDKNPSKWNLDILNNNFADCLNVNIFLRFSPYYNMDDLCDTLCDTQVYLNHIDDPVILSNSCNKMLLTPIATFDDAKNYLHHTLDGQALINQHPALATLISRIEDNSINFQPLYGWTLRESPSNLLNIILGSRYAQLHGENDIRKPLVIAAFFDLENNNEYLEQSGENVSNLAILEYLISDDNWGQYNSIKGTHKIKSSIHTLKLKDAFQTGKISNIKTIAQIEQLKSHEILLVSLPSLPKVVFDGLYTHSARNVFPPVREGASSLTSLLTTTGKPHIHCRSLFDWEINFDLADERLKTQLQDFNDLICRETYGGSLDFTAWEQHSIDKMIGQYIMDAYDHHSDLSQYFTRLKDAALKPENDRIQNDLYSGLSLMEKMSKSLVLKKSNKPTPLYDQTSTSVAIQKIDSSESHSPSYLSRIFDSALHIAVNYASSVINSCPSYFTPVSRKSNQPHPTKFLQAHGFFAATSSSFASIASSNATLAIRPN